MSRWALRKKTNRLYRWHWSIKIWPIHAYQSMFKLLSARHQSPLRQVQQRQLEILNHCSVAVISFFSLFLRLQQRVEVERKGEKNKRKQGAIAASARRQWFMHKPTCLTRQCFYFQIGLTEERLQIIFNFLLSVVLNETGISLLSLHIINSICRSHRILQVFENV